MTGDRVSRVERDGLALDVRDEGPLDGEPVVLLHGFPERATAWRRVAPLLHDAGCRTLAVDQRGYSPGARPSRRRDYRLSELVDDVVAVVDRLPDHTAHVVGHDWGAVVAWLLAAGAPERVRSLTAVSVPHPAAFAASMVRSPQVLRSWYMGFFQLPLVPEKAAASPLWERSLRRSGMSDDDIARFRREIVADGALRGGLGWYRAMPLPDPRAKPRKVTVPTTMVWSDGDAFVGPWPVRRTEEWVDAPYHLVALEGVSHWIPTQAPEALADAVLERVRGG